ncbi:MAG TPA: hypothetical protein VIS06_04260 [Mycobacteriales bacterium]
MTVDQLVALLALGAFHGVNPGMGWLFAVALGLQQRSSNAVLGALPAIAVGHLGSVTAVAVVIALTESTFTSAVVTVTGGALLVGFGLWRLLSSRHFRWAGMRLSRAQLVGWSFLMSSVHGAGLMLLPVLAYGQTDHADHTLHGAGSAAGDAVFAALVHTAAMLVVMGCVAMLVYRVFGLGFLRRAWVNLDKVWAVALIGAGVTTALIG